MKRMPIQERREVYRLAGAKAMILHGPSACLCDSLIQPHLPDEERAPLWRCSVGRLNGGVQGCWARVKEGGVLPDSQLAPWTPGFFLGLKLSGALVRKKNRAGREWMTYPPGARPWLERDLARMSPVHGRLHKAAFIAGTLGYRILARCPASDLPCRDPLGLDVLAGALAGAVWVKEGNERWLKVAGGCLGVLKAWGVPFQGDEWTHLLVSPFWGALLSSMMPPRLRGSFERSADSYARGGRIVGMGGCPLLPSVMWSMAMSVEFGRWMKSRWELPYGRTWDWWRFGDVPLKASGLPAEGLRMGMTRVRPEIRVLMVRWREGALERERLSGEKKVSEIPGGSGLGAGGQGGESPPLQGASTLGAEANPLQPVGVEGFQEVSPGCGSIGG